MRRWFFLSLSIIPCNLRLKKSDATWKKDIELRDDLSPSESGGVQAPIKLDKNTDKKREEITTANGRFKTEPTGGVRKAYARLESSDSYR